MPCHDIVVVGASAGGLDAVSRFVSDLPGNLPAAMFVVIHITPAATSRLAAILNRVGPLPATQAVHDQRIECGHIYVATPNHHLLIKDGAMAVVTGPKENRHRPAIDPLFRSAVGVYGVRVIGIILSGTGEDGVAGLRAIHDRGGITIVQDPADAAQADLPRHALEFVSADHKVRSGKLGALVASIVSERAPWVEPVPAPVLKRESQIARTSLTASGNELQVSRPSAFSCPDCGGVLWEVEEGDFSHVRCSHRALFTDAAADSQDNPLDRSLWAAFRSLEQDASLARQLAARARHHGRTALAERFNERAAETQANAELIRRTLLQRGSPGHAHARRRKTSARTRRRAGV